MSPIERANLNQIFTNFRKTYKEQLIETGIERIKHQKNTLNDIIDDIKFPEFLLDIEKANATETVPGRVRITVPLLSEPDLSIKIFKQRDFVVSSRPSTLEFTTAGIDSRQAVSNAKEILEILASFSESLTSEVKTFKAEYQKSIRDILDAEQQRRNESQRNNEELTSILRGK